jgi:hypothetical protein
MSHPRAALGPVEAAGRLRNELRRLGSHRKPVPSDTEWPPRTQRSRRRSGAMVTRKTPSTCRSPETSPVEPGQRAGPCTQTERPKEQTPFRFVAACDLTIRDPVGAREKGMQ